MKIIGLRIDVLIYINAQWQKSGCIVGHNHLISRPMGHVGFVRIEKYRLFLLFEFFTKSHLLPVQHSHKSGKKVASYQQCP